MPSRPSSVWAEVTPSRGGPSQHLRKTGIPPGKLSLGSFPLGWPTLPQICIMIQFIVCGSSCPILLLLALPIRSASESGGFLCLTQLLPSFMISPAMIYSKSLVFQVPSQILLLRGPVNIASLSSHYSKGLTLSSYPHTQRQCCFDSIYSPGASLVAQMVKSLPGDWRGPEGDLGLIPGSGDSPGEGTSNPRQCSCLENPMVEEPGRLQSMGSQRVRHNWVTSLSLITGALLLIVLQANKLSWRFFKQSKSFLLQNFTFPLIRKFLCS